MAKYYNIDPHTCTVEELKEAIAYCNGNVELFGALEQGCKRFINSVYGALGSKFYICANTAIAESVTLQGQDLIKFSSRKVNYLVHELWHKLNDIVCPYSFIINENDTPGEQIVDMVRFDCSDEDLLDKCVNHKDSYLFISNDTVKLGYIPFLDSLSSIKDKMEDYSIECGDKKLDGKRIPLVYENAKFIKDRLNIYRRIGYDMKKIDESFDVEAFVQNCSNQVPFPKETEKVGTTIDEATGETVPTKIQTLQVYGDTDSSYLTLQPLIDTCKIPNELSTKFILSFNEHIMSGYLDMQFIQYAKKFNCPVNLENFELEKVARSVIMQRKKKYVMDIAWDDSNTFYEPLHKVTFSGVEAVKGESSKFVRNEQKEFVRWIIENVNNGKKLRYPEIVAKIKQIKDRFRMAQPDDMCITKSMSDYEKFILNDKGKTVRFCEAPAPAEMDEDGDIIGGGTKTVTVPFHVKSAAWYNNLLYTSAKKYRSKYEIIHKGDKVRIYYVNNPMDEDHKTFAFLPGNFPLEFAPAIDIDTQFEKLILDPLNRYVEALGYNPIGAKLTYKTSLI